MLERFLMFFKQYSNAKTFFNIFAMLDAEIIQNLVAG